MSRRKNKSGEPGRSPSAGPKSIEIAETCANLQLYTPGDGATRGVRVVGEAPPADSRDAVVGIAGHIADATRERCTLYLATDVNQQLNLVAHIERKERSQIVDALLRQHLPKYRVERA